MSGRKGLTSSYKDSRISQRGVFWPQFIPLFDPDSLFLTPVCAKTHTYTCTQLHLSFLSLSAYLGLSVLPTKKLFLRCLSSPSSSQWFLLFNLLPGCLWGLPFLLSTSRYLLPLKPRSGKSPQWQLVNCICLPNLTSWLAKAIRSSPALSCRWHRGLMGF